ncbi:hypothetical protein ATO6_11295 [Oceanicola sp. 22II-s10i]|uniref:hypothetical protein n=1 Tax=Oceanicola sp. 22II-s10i TaxID=1317116 RepID=UPI000B527AAF|nr:hypothetical protein [Oceanicola sp. 22II-s10i]OWU84891.1 hypothetical protein ATO6_11295 [Oceanicola sp. 22II-s10i]
MSRLWLFLGAFVVAFAVIFGWAVSMIFSDGFWGADKVSYDRLDCVIDGVCEGTGCAELAPDFVLTPRGQYDRPYLSMSGRPSSLSALRVDGGIEYYNGTNEDGNLRITLAADNSFRLEKEFPSASGEIVARTSGHCRSVPARST